MDAEGRLLGVSERWLEFMGFAGRDAAIGRPVTRFMTEETAQRHREVNWPRLLTEGAFDDVERRFVKRSGEAADVLVSARVERDAAGRFVRTMAALVDITARRRAEERLALETAERAAAQERLRQAQRTEALGQLAGGADGETTAGVARIFITGSSDGLGRLAARILIGQEHAVVLHARDGARAREAMAAAPRAEAVLTGDLSSLAETRALAEAANDAGPFDAVVHNAAVGFREKQRIKTADGLPHVFAVNTLAPYVLTALMLRPRRLV